ncbi:hypothetical protein [Micromonospora sp. NPDC049645]|uniref:hypothetical protein n=1 Tax=Micromonospora sp. NPDC049645 TaxID=3155508 RepID=UPI003416EA7C
MGLTDPPWQFGYPDGTDRPCDGAAAIASLADRLDLHLTSWQADYERLRRRPAAYVSYDSTLPYTINKAALDTAQFNTVQLDTAGMVDLNKRPDRIYFPESPRPALYAVGGTLIGRAPTYPQWVDIRIATNCKFSYDVGDPNPRGFTEREENWDRGDPTGEVFSVGGLILAYQSIDSGSDLYMWLEIASSIEFAVTAANMWAFWLTDAIVT